jgi:amidase
MATSELCFTSAVELARRIRAREVSCLEVMDAHLAQIERVDPLVNAIVTLDAEGALAQAKQADERLARGDAAGLLFGLPTAVKDLVETRGLRTTYGSTLFRDHVPDEDALVVSRLRAAGAIVIGKTNTPEFGAGSQTFNRVFGATRNPWDTTRTCGGSSGGAAVAASCGMVPVADGSDLAASLRNPASFCNVVGFRPTPGRVPQWPGLDAWDSLATLGPIARSVGDVALHLAATSGPDARVANAWTEAGSTFAPPLEADWRGTRVAWSRTLGGLAVAPEVTSVLEAQRAVLIDLGCEVEEVEPDFSGAAEAFQVLRAHRFARLHAGLLERHREELKPTVVWNIEAGLKLSAQDVARAETERSAIFARFAAFFARHRFLACPTVQVTPFPLDVEYPTEISGRKMATYIDWLGSCLYVSVIAHPAISVPAGFTPEGLPVGLQIVGGYCRDLDVLRFAHAFERATRCGERHPPLALG